MQIWSEPYIRGRVMAIYTLLTLGTTVVGGPFIGWVCGRWSPRTGLALAGHRDGRGCDHRLSPRRRPRPPPRPLPLTELAPTWSGVPSDRMP